MKKILLTLLLATLLLPATALADGMLLPEPNRFLWETDQNAVIFYEDGVEKMIVEVTYTGDASSFTWIVPTPAEPKVSKSSAELFRSLEKFTEIKKNNINQGFATKSDYAVAPREVVNVIERKNIEYYDVAILEATSAEDLYEWLRANDYSYPANGKNILNNYIDNGWFFTAVRFNDDYLRNKGLKTVQNDIILPVPEPRAELCYDSEGRFNYEKKGYVKTQGGEVKWDHCTDSSNLMEYYCGNNYELRGYKYKCDYLCEDGACINQARVIVEQRKMIPLEFEFETTSPVYPLRISSLESEYNESSRLSRDDSFGITLYTIAEGKYESSSFDTLYAGYVDRYSVEGWASDDNGAPLLSLNGNRDEYFLTKLHTKMAKDEMTYDVYLNKSLDDKAINAPEKLNRDGFMRMIVLMIISGFVLLGSLVYIIIKK